MKRYTVFGGRGFIGSEIVSMLEAAGQDVWVPPRDDESVFDTDLGIVGSTVRGRATARMPRWVYLTPTVVCWPICWLEANLSVSSMSLPPVYT